MAAVAVLAAPAVAFAQNGAGDEQYTDPFANQSQPAPKAKPRAQATPRQQAPAQAAPQATARTAPQPTAQAPGTTGSGAQLPRTGFDVAPVALAGLALLAAGLALLRRRAVHGRD
jgi:LPXTG-motif cell wall-anchored protein